MPMLVLISKRIPLFLVRNFFLKRIVKEKIKGQDSATKGIVLQYPQLENGSGNIEVTLKCDPKGPKNYDVAFSVDSWDNSTIKISGSSFYGKKKGRKFCLKIFVGCPLKNQQFLQY